MFIVRGVFIQFTITSIKLLQGRIASFSADIETPGGCDSIALGLQDGQVIGEAIVAIAWNVAI